MIVNNSQEAVAPSVASKSRRSRRASKEKIIGNMACPECRKAGGDSTGNHMMLFESGAGYCNRCPKSFSVEQVKEARQASSSPRRTRRQYSGGYNNNYQKDMTVDDMVHLGYLGEKHRGISAATDRHFGIRTETDTTNGKPLARYYPYHVEGELYGYKKRILPKDWGKDVGTIKGTDMFGWHLLSGKYQTLIIVEGEEDTAACWQLHKAMNNRSTNRRIKRSDVDVVSLPSGSKGAQKSLLHHIEEISKYKKVYWAGDNYKIDVEGKACLEVAVQVIGVDKLYVMEYPERRKDLCDVLKIGDEDAIDTYSEMYFGAKPYSPADVIDGSQLTLEDIEKDVVVGYSLPYPCLQEPLQGMRLYEHTVITSSAGSGKSSLITAIAHHMSREHGWMVGNIFLEEKSVKSQQRYIAYDNSVALNEYRKDFNIIPPEDKVKTKEELIDNMLFLDHSGSIDVDVLMNKIRYMSNKGCKLIILDHLSLVVTGSDDERAQLDDLMEKIYRYVEHTPIHILSVVHINRGDGKKDPSKGFEITPSHIRNSSGVMQMAFNLGCVEGWNECEKWGNTRFIRWLKIRETGDLGLTKGCLEYSQKTGRFTYNPNISKKDVEEEKAEENKPTYKPSMGGGSYDNKAV